MPHLREKKKEYDNLKNVLLSEHGKFYRVEKFGGHVFKLKI